MRRRHGEEMTGREKEEDSEEDTVTCGKTVTPGLLLCDSVKHHRRLAVLFDKERIVDC